MKLAGELAHIWVINGQVSVQKRTLALVFFLNLRVFVFNYVDIQNFFAGQSLAKCTDIVVY